MTQVVAIMIGVRSCAKFTSPVFKIDTFANFFARRCVIVYFMNSIKNDYKIITIYNILYQGKTEIIKRNRSCFFSKFYMKQNQRIQAQAATRNPLRKVNLLLKFPKFLDILANVKSC